MEYVFPMLAFIGGVYLGMTIAALMVAAGRADKLLESATAGCCNHDCNQGKDCPQRKQVGG
jgi:hypothetical protein